jgi:hypothetical protein
MILSVFSLALICIYPHFFQRVNLLQRLQLSHYMPWRRLGGEEVQLLLILDLSARWDEWSASGLPSGQQARWAPEPVWTQRLEEKIFCFCRRSNPDCLAVQSIDIILTELPQLAVLHDMVLMSLGHFAALTTNKHTLLAFLTTLQK